MILHIGSRINRRRFLRISRITNLIKIHLITLSCIHPFQISNLEFMMIMGSIKKPILHNIIIRNIKSLIVSLCPWKKHRNLFPIKIIIKVLHLPNIINLMKNKNHYFMNSLLKILINNKTQYQKNKVLFNRWEASQNHLKKNKLILLTRE